MASTLSKAWETKILKTLRGSESLTAPTTWLALYTTVPNRTTAGTEAGYTGYKRIKIEAAHWTITEGTESEAAYMVNNVKIEFPECTASESKVKGSALTTAESAGEQIAVTEVTETVINTTNNLPYIPAESLKFQLS